MTAYRVAFYADAHLGYGGTVKCATHPASGLGMRTRDTYLAHRERISQIIEAAPDLVIDGGDIFHSPRPSTADIRWGRDQAERLHKAGIPLIGVTGNHDATKTRATPSATAVLHDPDRNLNFVTEPTRRIEVVPGLYVHVLTHLGLARAERIIPTPVDGAVNLLTSHGAAMVPGHEIFHCTDSPNEQPIGLDILGMDWASVMLGHYHGMGPLPGFDTGHTGQVWYAGSSVRRGWSDPEGGRGWLLYTIESDGSITIERKYINQRPQFDLPVVDATGLTGSDVTDRVLENLSKVDVGDAMVRQIIRGCTVVTENAIDVKTIRAKTQDALIWKMPCLRPTRTVTEPGELVDGADTSLTSAGSVDLPSAYDQWATEWVEGQNVPDKHREPVIRTARKYLEDSAEAAPAREKDAA